MYGIETLPTLSHTTRWLNVSNGFGGSKKNLAATRYLRRAKPHSRAPSSLWRPGAAHPLPAWAALPIPRPPGSPRGAVRPRALGSTSNTHRLYRARQAPDPAPRRAPGRAAGKHHREGRRHRQAEREPQPGTLAGNGRERTEPGKSQPALPTPGSAGPLTAANRRSPHPRVRGRETLLPLTLILLSTPLLSSVCTSRSRSSVSSSVAAAAILFLPDNRPNCASGRMKPADSPQPQGKASAQHKTRRKEAR